MKGLFSVLIFGVLLISCSHEPTWEKRFLDKDKGLNARIKSPEVSNGQFPDSLPKIQIRVGRSDQVQINDETCDISDLQKIYNEYQDKHKGLGVVHYNVHNYTTYGNFSRIHAIIEEYNKKAKLGEAINTFDIHYDDLTPRQRQIIDASLPIRIVEYKMGE